MTLKLGIIGTGRLGGFHAEKAKADPQVELVGIYDTRKDRTLELAEKLGVRAFDSPDELASEVQAAVIAVPSVLHYEMAKPLLERKIHLLIEKPMTVDSGEAAELVETARRQKVVLLAGHTEQFNKAWQIGTESLRKRTSPILIHAKRTSGYTFRSVDIGAVLDLMIHDLELVLSVIPHEIVSVEAVGFSTVGGHEDIADARLAFAEGSVVHLFASRVHPSAERKMQIQTAHQFCEIDFAAGKAFSMTASPEVIRGEFAPGQPVGISPQILMQEKFLRSETVCDASDALALEMSDFAETVLTNRPSRFLSGERAAQAVHAAAMILDKIQSGSPGGRLPHGHCVPFGFQW
ncbi:MAG: Gfo/Idh/MocA family oxidoreductase [Planctomycetaceae bacterium]|jgi:predicted dehydrogenase|nr:Gfo/Idh/MocA family oxidoreductase [Planctomycetaceae bacterium]